MTRREAIAGILVAAAPLAAQKSSKPKSPTLCVYSKALSGVGYSELGDIVKQLGFDAVDVGIIAGGLVEPRLAPVDEVRALESLQAAGLETPIITTGLVSPYEPWCRTVLALAGRTGVALFKCGLNRSNASLQTRRDAFGLAGMGRDYKIGFTLPTAAIGNEYNFSEAQNLMASLDPALCGLSLNSDCFAAKSGIAEAQIQAILPLVKSITLGDFTWRETPGSYRAQEWRPLGQGSVDFERMFNTLARAGFTGPMTVERNYRTDDEPGAISRDAEFARKHLAAAYNGLKT